MGKMRKRGQFIVKGPNRVWSIDGHDKLSRFGFQIYAAIDAYSRYIIWCYIGHSNRTAVSVNKQFLETVRIRNIFPKLIRSDKGGETTLLCNSQLALRRAGKPDLQLSKAYSYGTSTKNQRIESWWNLLANAQTDTWRNMFTDLEQSGYFDGGAIDVICLQYVYMKMIRTHIQTFVQVHNTHRIRRQRNREHYLPTGKPTELYNYPPVDIHDYGTAPDTTILSLLEAQVSAYSLDEYLTPDTQLECEKLLLNGGYPVEFTFDDNHRAGYIFLRQALMLYIKNGGNNISVLEPPLGADRWLMENAEQELNSGGPPMEFQIDLTDDENDILSDIDFIKSEDEENISENEYVQLDDFLDDGFVLDI